MRPKVILKVAMSLDGYLDDASETRRVFSSKADFNSVDVLRSQADAILIGAETLRKDNPGLRVRSKELIELRKSRNQTEQPKGVVLSRTADFESGYKFFQKENIVCLPSSNFESSTKKINEKSEFIFFEKIEDILEALYERGIRNLLVEGGASVHSQFLSAKLFDELRVCIAPVVLGENGVTRFSIPELTAPLTLTKTEVLEGCTVHFYKLLGDLK